MVVFFDMRRDILNSITFEESFWQNLTAESAFLARTFFAYCQSNQLNMILDNQMPETMRHAFLIQKYINLLSEAAEDAKPEIEFIIEQLLRIAAGLDFGDETGRRKMFNLLRKKLILSVLTKRPMSDYS